MRKAAWVRKGQDVPGWEYVVAMLIGLAVLIFLIWLAIRSGRSIAGIFRGFQ